MILIYLMSEQYYKIISTGIEYESSGRWNDVILEPVDIGWRSVDDELPDEHVSVAYDIDENGDILTAYYKRHGDAINWYDDMCGSIVEVEYWYKMPPPPKDK